MKKIIVAFSLALCFMIICGPSAETSAQTVSSVYTKKCGIALPPAIVGEYSRGISQSEEPPATAFLYLDSELKLAGDVPLQDALSELDATVVPVLYVSDENTADAVADFVQAEEIIDCILASANAALVSRMRAECREVQGLVDFRGKEIKSPCVIRNTVNCSDAKIALLDAEQADYDTVEWLQQRLITVWCEAETEKDIYAAVVRGCDGIYAADVQLAYDLLTTFDELSFAHKPMIVGHRGIYSEKENSLAAAKLAYEVGADAVECDIYLTKDDQIVIMHDGMMDSTTTGTGSVEDKTLEEIRQYKIDVGGGDELRPIATLEDFFAEFKGKDLIHFIEIKSNKAEIIPALKALIEKYDVSDQVVVISFIEKQLQRVREQMPELSVGLLTDIPSSADVRSINQQIAPLNATVNPSYGTVTNDLINDLSARGITVWPWTYNMPEKYFKAFMNGVHGITTDYADLASNFVVRLAAEDIMVGKTPAQATPIMAQAITQKGELTNVACDYLIVSGGMDLQKTDDGKYYSKSGQCTALLKYYFELNGVSYVIYSEPIEIRVDESLETSSGCSSNIGMYGGIIGLVLLSAVCVVLINYSQRSQQ